MSHIDDTAHLSYIHVIKPGIGPGEPREREMFYMICQSATHRYIGAECETRAEADAAAAEREAFLPEIIEADDMESAEHAMSIA